MILALQIGFSLGIFLIALLSKVLMDWKEILGFFIIVPSILTLIVSIWLVEETPQTLLKHGKAKLLKSLNRIASINGREKLDSEEVE